MCVSTRWGKGGTIWGDVGVRKKGLSHSDVEK
jgi:hypothetical protein